MSHIIHSVYKNWQPFSHKTYKWVYIEYFLLNQLLAYLPKTDMECIV